MKNFVHAGNRTRLASMKKTHVLNLLYQLSYEDISFVDREQSSKVLKEALLLFLLFLFLLGLSTFF